MSSKTTNPVKLSINNMHIVARWQYNVDNTECSLCHMALGKPVTVGTGRDKTYKTTITIGACNHGFHESCMNGWLANKNQTCPLCLTTWKKENNVNCGVMMYSS